MANSSTLGSLQPCFIPWLGYFEQIAIVDNFILLDTVQYTKADWRNRNRIKTANGPCWLTVPVQRHSLNAKLYDITIDYSRDWVRKLLMTIEQSYAKCRYFEPVYSQLADVLIERPVSLVQLNLKLITIICQHLSIDTPIHLASKIQSTAELDIANISDPNSRLIAFCQYFGAVKFYEGASGRNYLDVDAFQSKGIDVIFQDYKHPTYHQRFAPFISHLSVIDLIMNEGPNSAELVRKPSNE